MTLLTEVSEDEFDNNILKSEGLFLVDFYADWCGPCKAMVPALEDTAREFADELKIVKINTDHAPNLSERYTIRGIPAFLVVKNGEIVDRFGGVQTRTELTAIVEKHLESE